MKDNMLIDEARLFGRILCKKPCAGFSVQHEVKLNDEKKRVYLVAQCSVPVGELVNDSDVSKPIMVEVSERETVVSAVEDGDIM